ncbi:MAG: T9SS type A sorting domain-containing protein [Ignavibacteriaceae bacterium]|nr:T9SS type A sorting domain-containing protein [Ignavibacteriaceae bacterium]
MNINSSGDLFIGGAHNTAYLCRSTDGANTWEPLNNLNTNQGSVICISFDASDNVYVGTGTGIYKSTDNGDNWALYGNFTSQTEAIAFNDSGHVFAGTSYAVYRSADDGANWTQLPTGGGTRTVWITPNGYIFAGCWENGGILLSTDNGDSWNYSYPQTVQVRSASTPFFDDYNYIYFPTQGKGVLFSSDYGNSWTEFNDGLGNNNVRAVTKTLNQFLFAGGDYGLFKCNSWAGYPYWYSTGLPVCGVKKIEIDQYDNVFTGVWGVNRSLDEGQSWETINNGLSNLEVKEMTIKNDGTIFIGCGINGPCIFRSTDNGNTWIVIENEIQRHDVEAITVDAAGNIYAGNYYGVYKSTNNGDNWVNIGGVGGARALQFNSSGDLFLASYGQGLWQLPAGDTNWVNLTSNIGASWITCMLISANGYIYAAGKKSTDNGITWTDMGTSGSWLSCYAENSIGHLFGGDYYTGVYRSTDYGDNWQQINTGLTITDIRSLAFDSDDYLYAGTNGKSIFKTTTSTVTSVKDKEFKPTSFTLEQNYPNPFNPSTKISWQSPIGIHQTIKVFDVLGNEIITLVDEYKPAGRYEVEFNSSSIRNLASGIYFYQLRAGEYKAVKKMLLIK